MGAAPVIIVNGRKVAVVPNHAVSYRDIADLADCPGMPSMTCKQEGREGRIIHPGESVIPIDGMIFNVYDTSNA
jgi:hypothetical protein